MSRPKDSRVRAPSFVDGGANRGGQSAAQSGMMRVTSKTLSFLTIARECAFPSFCGLSGGAGQGSWVLLRLWLWL